MGRMNNIRIEVIEKGTNCIVDLLFKTARLCVALAEKVNQAGLYLAFSGQEKKKKKLVKLIVEYIKELKNGKTKRSRTSKKGSRTLRSKR